MKKYMMIGVLALGMLYGPAMAQEVAKEITVEQALMQLKEGNRRFAMGKSIYPRQGIDARKATGLKQKPVAVILGCSDSRVTPEMIFDQGIGDLLVVRLAGNIVTDAALGSIEYAVTHLGAQLVVVLGHGRCDAVSEALKGSKAEGHRATQMNAIKAPVERAKMAQGDRLANAVKFNVYESASILRSSRPVLEGLVKKKKVQVVGAVYDEESGKVTVSP